MVLATVAALQTFTIPAFCSNEEWELVLKVFYLLREGLFHILVWWLLPLGQVRTIPLNLMWPPIVKTEWDNRWGEVLAWFSVRSLFQAHRDMLESDSMFHGVVVPLKPGLSQEGSIFWRLWMTFWLQGNALPVVWIYFWFILKIMVIEDPCSLSISAMGCWESQDFRVVSARRCKMFPWCHWKITFPGHVIWEWSVCCCLNPRISYPRCAFKDLCQSYFLQSSSDWKES